MGCEAEVTAAVNYSEKYRPAEDVKVIKSDGTLEAFIVQKVLNGVG